MKLRDRFMKFMQGRYGVDQYSRFLVVAGLIATIISRFLGPFGLIINLLGMIMFIFSYVRVFSKDINKRYQQNQQYLNKSKKIRAYFKGFKNSFNQRKTHKIFKCPSCKQKIRVPKGRGKIEIKCPKCHTKFVRKS